VVAIIGILIALTIPAVQMARESARRSACANSLRQHSVAIKLHEETHKIYPTGGWGADWVGDPDNGYGPEQPGGWIYNVLPYIEQTSLREFGSGLKGAAKRDAVAQLLATPLELFNCPSRRPTRQYPYTGPQPLRNADPPPKVAKSDYAINKQISYVKSEVIVSEIQLARGLSKTVMVGEKSVSRIHYSDGEAPGDTLAMYVGDSEDIRRETSGRPVPDSEISVGFGSAHPSGYSVAMCDGAVRFILFEEQLEP
jgi:type II secretory pathway pseudopilin PulG